MKSLGLNATEGDKAKVYLNKDDAIQFEPRKTASIFKQLWKQLLIVPNKFNGNTIKYYYTGIMNNKRNDFQLLNLSEDFVKKILPRLNINKKAGIDQISVNFWKKLQIC